jgi:hypothetical protein
MHLKMDLFDGAKLRLVPVSNDHLRGLFRSYPDSDAHWLSTDLSTELKANEFVENCQKWRASRERYQFSILTSSHP